MGLTGGLGRELAVGISSAIAGALLLSLFSLGFRWTQATQEVRKKLRDTEIQDWKSGDALKRQRIFNGYLFAVLKFFILANIVTAIGSPAADLEPGGLRSLTNTDYALAVIDSIAAVFYIAALAKILQFTRLLRQHP